jgi:hypothetical protein
MVAFAEREGSVGIGADQLFSRGGSTDGSSRRQQHAAAAVLGAFCNKVFNRASLSIRTKLDGPSRVQDTTASSGGEAAQPDLIQRCVNCRMGPSPTHKRDPGAALRHSLWMPAFASMTENIRSRTRARLRRKPDRAEEDEMIAIAFAPVPGLIDEGSQDVQAEPADGPVRDGPIEIG